MINRILQAKESIESDILSDLSDEQISRFIIEFLHHETDAPYSTLLETIFHYRIDEKEARKIWHGIIDVRAELTEKTGRPIGIKTAIVDYFSTMGMDDRIVVLIKDNMVNVMNETTLDALTGVCSREFILSELEREFARAARYAIPLSVMFMDIDNFKSFNDTYGHQTGDKVLAEVGSLLKGTVRVTDKIGRYGGDEFLVILPHTVIGNAVKTADKICAEIAECTVSNSALPSGVTVSVGLAEKKPEMKKSADLIYLADRAMYRAKLEGRNRCCSSQ
jgi:diguanylate cyclase (GGDEF)-like protein